jgi:hypothetical protein
MPPHSPAAVAVARVEIGSNFLYLSRWYVVSPHLAQSYAAIRITQRRSVASDLPTVWLAHAFCRRIDGHRFVSTPPLEHELGADRSVLALVSVQPSEGSGVSLVQHEDCPMVDVKNIKEHMKVIGADGVPVGTVDRVVDGRIKLTKADSGEGRHKGHHHYIGLGLVADIEGDKVRLSANANVAVTMEEEK